MKKSTLFLQAVIILIGIVALLFLFLEPQHEGRNIDATLFEIYFKDPFLAYAYIASIPFFYALYKVFTLLRYVRQDTIFSLPAVRALRTIRNCAIAIIGFAIPGELFIMFHETDDRAGGIAMGVLIIFCTIIVATVSSMFERIVEKKLRS